VGGMVPSCTWPAFDRAPGSPLLPGSGMLSGGSHPGIGGDSPWQLRASCKGAGRAERDGQACRGPATKHGRCGGLDGLKVGDRGRVIPAQPLVTKTMPLSGVPPSSVPGHLENSLRRR
jgi:hypothetical protein